MKPRSQRSLFLADQVELPFEDDAAPLEPPPAWTEEQLLLFEGPAPLMGGLEQAMWDADFEKAHVLYEELRETYPDIAHAFEFLSAIPAGLWSEDVPDANRMAHWSSIARALGPGTVRFRRVRDGFFRRLLAESDAGALASSSPAFAPDIANALSAVGERRRAREAVREALLAGNELRPLEFEDPEVADLLGEDEPAPWLASLGAIRFLRRRHEIVVEDVEALERDLGSPLPEDDLAKALDFWRCLCVSALGKSVSEGVLHGAHKRMKRLHPRFHSEYFTGERRTP